jgi:hypothetical protein
MTCLAPKCEWGRACGELSCAAHGFVAFWGNSLERAISDKTTKRNHGLAWSCEGDDNIGQATIAIAEIGQVFLATLKRLDFEAEGRLHGLDDSLIRHLLKHHGETREYDRGQEPVTTDEIANFYRLVEQGVTKLPDRQFQKVGKNRIQTNLSSNGRSWTIVCEIRRKLIVPVTAWKKL